MNLSVVLQGLEEEEEPGLWHIKQEGGCWGAREDPWLQGAMSHRAGCNNHLLGREPEQWAPPDTCVRLGVQEGMDCLRLVASDANEGDV